MAAVNFGASTVAFKTESVRGGSWYSTEGVHVAQRPSQLRSERILSGQAGGIHDRGQRHAHAGASVRAATDAADDRRPTGHTVHTARAGDAGQARGLVEVAGDDDRLRAGVGRCE
jgi:hypothetical protein